MTGDLFASAAAKRQDHAPLAQRMRPKDIDDVVGQDHILGEGKALRQLIKRGELPSLILWGPPGTGKTTLAHILAATQEATCETLSAVMAGVKDIRDAVARATERQGYHNKRTVVFIDEIHRFNKSQQDALLPHVESGLFTLIGATTENPSFELNAALLSRARVFVLEALAPEAVGTLILRAMDRDSRLQSLSIDTELAQTLATECGGDARRALTTLEVAADICRGAGRQELTREDLKQAAQAKTLLYDKNGDEHYQVISAFIKSMRGSDPDAAVYWLARMLEAGEDPRFIARRMIIFASEDIGNADPRALSVAVDAQRAFDVVGLAEGYLALTQAATYLAVAPKSNAAIKAYHAAKAEVVRHGALPVPMHLRNADTGLQKNLGYGKDYRYPHDAPGHFVDETYVPQELKGKTFYQPSNQGLEQRISESLKARRENKS